MTSDTAHQPTELADRVREAALQVPGVIDLTSGLLGEIATYLPGRQVAGVRVRGDAVEVHIVAGQEIPLPVVAAALTRAIRALGVARVDVHIDDVRDGGEPVPTVSDTNHDTQQKDRRWI